MKRPLGLRQRLFRGILGYVVLLSSAVVVHGYLVNERAESLVWESTLESELAHLAARSDDSTGWADTETLMFYGALSGKPIPPELASLSAGVHDEIRVGDRLLVVLVRDVEQGRVALALDISEMESDERRLTLTMLASSAAVVALLALVTHFAAGRLVRPLASIARSITSLSPTRSGQGIRVERSAPQEAIVIANAVNDYLRRIDAFVERERAFVNMASHELRTPIAVICGSAEVALDRRTEAASAKPYLEHILRTARDMERLVALLLALAKDPARLHATTETVDLAELLPAVIEDHRFLASTKELSFEVGPTTSRQIQAPPQIARAAIGNLIRNAIENSDRGVVKVSLSDQAQVVIQDPGHGMSDDELTAIYTKLARSGELASSGGIGIDLISRLCEHLGWRLSFSSRPEEGTTAVLDFGVPG